MANIMAQNSAQKKAQFLRLRHASEQYYFLG